MKTLARTLAALTILFSLALAGAGAARAANVYALRAAVNPGYVYEFGVAGDGSLALSPSEPISTGGHYGSGVGISADGRHLYATNSESTALAQFGIAAAGSLSPLSPATATVAKGSYAPVVSPDGSSLYIGHTSPSAQIEQLTVGADGTVAAKTPASVAVGWVNDIVLSPDGRYLYVSNFGFPGRIFQYGVQADGTLKPLAPAAVETGPWPVGMAVSPDGRSLYAGTESATGILQFTIAADGTLAPMPTPNLALPGGDGADRLAVSADGANLYATSSGEGIVQAAIGAGGALSLLSPAKVAATANPESLAVSPDGRSLYVGLYTGELLTRFAIGAGGALSPTGEEFPQTHLVRDIAVSPDQGPTAALSATPALAGSATGFDASGSSDPDGAVVRYAWSFGDGATATTTSPQTAHVYAHGGDYTAAVTVTDNEGASASRAFTGHQVLLNGGPQATASAAVHVPSPVPAISAAKVKPKRFAVGSPTAKRRGKGPRRGAHLSFRLDVGGAVVERIEQRRRGHHHNGKCSLVAKHGKRCVTWKPLKGSVVLKGKAGANRLAFAGSFRGRKLKPGAYRFALTPRAEGQAGATAHAKFTILPG